jgi:DNA-damage-inducible protein D
MTEDENALVVFRGKEIRRTLHDGEWHFVVIDVVSALTDSANPTDYLKKLRKRDASLNEGWGQFVTPLDIQTSGGIQLINCVNTENAFRLIQSIPSKKAEPFKRWLAKVGYDRVQEIENPELAQKRMKELYRAKGYSDAWIEKRLRGIAVRDELTDEWDRRGIETDIEFSILTAEISKATFGLTPTEYLAHKGLNRQNLRDHMNDLELIFTMLGEAATTEIARTKDAQGFTENKDAAREGGTVSGNAKQELET